VRGRLISARRRAWVTVRTALPVGSRSQRGPIGRPGGTDAHAERPTARERGVGVRLKGPVGRGGYSRGARS